jgi:hypothetical protein
MANPFITQADPMMGQTLIDPESLALQRQKQYAAALLQQGQQPQGQMIGGRFVAPSITQQLSSALNPLLGAYMLNQADTKQAQLAEAIRQQGDKDLMAYGQAVTPVAGVEAKPEFIPKLQTAMDDQGMPTMGYQAPVEAVPEKKADFVKGMQILRMSKDPENRQLAKMLMADQMKTLILPEGSTAIRGSLFGSGGQTVQGVPKYRAPIQVDTGTTIEFRDPTDPTKVLQVVKKSMSMKDMAELVDKGIIVGGGGMPIAGGGQPVKPTGDARYMPSSLPTYEYDPTLPPATNRDLQAKFAQDLQKSVKNAKDAFGSIKAVSEILKTNEPSSGLAENIMTGTREIFGGGGKQSQADAKLKVLGQKLVQQVPRFEGPQSDKDVASYQAAAGDIGNANKPIGARLAALQVLVDLNKKYYPNGEWDSINLDAPKIKPNMLGGTNTYFGATVENPKPNLVFDPATGKFK